MNPKIYAMGGFRAAESPAIDLQLGINPLVTQLVLGQPQARSFPSSQILRPIQVPNMLFQYTTWPNNETLKAYDTERQMRAPIATADFAPSYGTDRLRRFSFGTLRDVDEFTNAEPSLNMRQKCASFGKRIVDMSIERIARDLLLTTGNYNATGGNNYTTLAGGSEWDAAGGDSRSDIRTASAVICGKTGLQPQDLRIWLSQSAYDAALSDPVFLAVRSNFTSNQGSLADLQQYWGLGAVTASNPVELADDGTITPMYSDAAIVYYPGDGSDYDTEYGDVVFAVNFTWNRGVASNPFYSELHTSWMFPWTAYGNPKIINNKAGYLILNCKA